MTTHMLDDVRELFGYFDAFSPRDRQVYLMKLEFVSPLIGDRRAEIYDAIVRFSSLGDVSIGLVFWPPVHPSMRSPEESFQRLAATGVGQADRWLLRSETSSEDPLVSFLFYSQSIDSLTGAADALSQLVVLLDHGSWDRISASLYVWARAGVLLRFWDDRGADVLCRDASTLAACRELFREYEM